VASTTTTQPAPDPPIIQHTTEKEEPPPPRLLSPRSTPAPLPDKERQPGRLARLLCLPRKNRQQQQNHPLRADIKPTKPKAASGKPSAAKHNVKRRVTLLNIMSRADRSSSDGSSSSHYHQHRSRTPKLGKVGEKSVYELEERDQQKWVRSQDKVRKVIERNPAAHNIGPKPLSLLEAYETNEWDWTLQRRRTPTIVISCSSKSYGKHLKKTIVKSELLKTLLGDFSVIVIQGTFEPCPREREEV
jgi:hypothetical protein